uniref:Uncharacterized protein n=1 Tax=Acrobeloides nanus TaxID=290746 RepID=A0A914D9L8_9BILA
MARSGMPSVLINTRILLPDPDSGKICCILYQESWPTVEDAYHRQKSDLVRSIPNTINVSIDENFDSPGYSAELCVVAGNEEATHQVLDIAVVHKSEVDGNVEIWSSKVFPESVSG